MEIKQINEFTVFISCPGDLSPERQVVEQAINTFSERHKDRNISFSAFHFEQIPSTFGDTPQNIINEALPDFDIYIGLMGNRFGTATEKFGSGTEEEFRNALDKKNTRPNTHVAFFFKNAPSPIDQMNDEQIQQYLKVRQFKNGISSLGLFQDFDNNDKLLNQVNSVLLKHLEKHNQARSQESLQMEMLAEVPSENAFVVNSEFYASFLNSIGAELTNNHKERLFLEDVYVPIDLNKADIKTDRTEDVVDDDFIISSSDIEYYNNQSETKIIIAGDESSGKTVFCKRAFLNFHKRGVIPVYVQGSEIKNAPIENALKIIEKNFTQQFSNDALPRYKTLSANKKILIIDNIEDSKINNKHKFKLLNELESHFAHIIVTTEPLFLFNANISSPEDFKLIAHFYSYETRDIGHKLRDSLVRKWIMAGREDLMSEEDVFATAERYRQIIDSVLGTNFVPKKPFIVLVLLQAIQGGSANDLSHSSFVRYYKYLIDTMLLGNAPKNKIELYYAFLPEISYSMFTLGKKILDQGELDQLIDAFCAKKGLAKHDLLDVKSNLIALEVLLHENESYSFKHNYTYYYFLGQYFSDRISAPEIRAQVREVCKNLNLKENANIIVFLSYHTNDTLIIDEISKIVETLFSGKEAFEFSRQSSASINRLVSEGPKLFIEHEAHKERESVLENRDQIERTAKQQNTDIDKEELEASDFIAQLNLAFRSIEIIGQLLKNHYVKFDAQPKKELFQTATNVSLRSLGFWIEHISRDTDFLIEIVQQIDPKINNKKDAEKAVFSLAYAIIFSFVKATSKFLGADTLAKTYEDALHENRDTVHRIIDLSIKLDFFDSFPMHDLKNLIAECKHNHLATVTIQSLVKHRLYMRPLDDYKQKQQICDIAGISLNTQFRIDKKSSAA